MIRLNHRGVSSNFYLWQGKRFCFQYCLYLFSSVLWHCWLGDRKGIRPVKTMLVYWWQQFKWSFARLIAPVVTTTSITLSSKIIKNGDIPVPVNPGPPGKLSLKRRETVYASVYEITQTVVDRFGSVFKEPMCQG